MPNQTIYFNNPTAVNEVIAARNSTFVNSNRVLRQKSNYPGVNILNTNYLPATLSNWKSIGLPTYDMFKTVQVNPKAAQASYCGVCDEDYVYYPWELGEDGPIQIPLIAGVGWTNYQNVFTTKTTVFVKQSRETGNVVMVKPMGEITGIPSTNTLFLETTGDDQTRGPFVIYDGHIYTTGQGFKYYSILKIRCSDLTLVWRADVYEPGSQYLNFGDFALNSSGFQFRTTTVLPPNPSVGRTSPLVICGASAAVQYGNASYGTTLKLFNYYTGKGQVFAYSDEGDHAVYKWKFSSITANYKAGDLLNSGSFRRASNGNLIEGTKIYYPLINGYVFQDGNPSTGIEKTSGTFNLLTGVVNPDGYEFAKFTFNNGTTFNNTNSYTGIVQNGPRQGQSVTVPGTTFYTVAASGALQDYQPVVKELYISQIGVKVLNSFEAAALSCYGASVYGNFTYDETSDTVMFGTANAYHVPYEQELFFWSTLNGSNANSYIANNPVWLGADHWMASNGTRTVLPAEPTTQQIADTRTAQRNMWTSIDNFFENNNLGSNYNRCLNDSIIGLNANNGAIKFVIPMNNMDVTDFPIQTAYGFNKTSIFHSGGFNQDCAKGCVIANINKTVGNITVNGKYLLCTNKSRLFIFDFNNLMNKITGVQGDTSLDYSKGIVSNNYIQALVWRQREGALYFVNPFNGLSFDGERLIVKYSGNVLSAVTGNEVFEAGLEKHFGYLKSPLSPSNSPTVVCFNIPEVIANLPTSASQFYKWAFVHELGVGIIDSGSIITHGDVVISGSKDGALYFIDKYTGKLINTIYNAEGMATVPCVADGVLYGYGGNTKWTPGATSMNLGSFVYMITPYGK